MYDILQLNDMLVPELLDIAEQLKIPNAKRLGKQDLVYKILDSQAIAGSKGASQADDKGKRKRIIKTTTGITTEEAVVENNGEEDKKQIKKIPMPPKKDTRIEPIVEKLPIKRGRKKPDEKEDGVDGNTTEQAAAPEQQVENGSQNQSAESVAGGEGGQS